MPCPSEVKAGRGFSGRRQGGYGLNACLDGDKWSVLPPKKLAKLDPGRILIADANILEQWDTCSFLKSILSDTYHKASFRHRGTANFLFIGGHVTGFSLSQAGSSKLKL